jgi:N6-L-threonylcarbamoyladenine synthase
MSPAAFIGIDTSCYTTSLAAVDGEGRLLADERRPLPVPTGHKGLSQGSMIFYHLRNLPELLEKFFGRIEAQVAAVAASVKPRPLPQSYMPVFSVGETLGVALASALRVPFLPATHQEGHIWAGVWASGLATPERFLAVHLSGGTSEILLVENRGPGEEMNVTLLGGTRDLSAGQLIDRVGVLLGLAFPCGPSLEELARQAPEEGVYIPSSVRGLDFSFSGAETRARRLLEEGAEPAAVARAVERCVAKTLEKVLRRAVDETGTREVLLVGGVAANSYIRERLKQRLSHHAVGARLYFAPPAFSTDNAVGVAVAARNKILSRRQE